MPDVVPLGVGKVPDDDRGEEGSGEEEMMPSQATENSAEEGSPRRVLSEFYQWQWLDVKDTEDAWMEAQVVRVDEKTAEIVVHYKGWADRYDEVFCTDPYDANRIAPLHTHTSPVDIDPSLRVDGLELEVGASVDALDSVGKWEAASIVDRDSKNGGQLMIKVHYSAWAEKFDDWINADSYRIAKSGSFVRAQGTGEGKRVPAVNPALKRSKSSLQATANAESRYRERLLEVRGFEIEVQEGDGNCLFRSVCQQVYGTAEHHALVRQKCIDYVEAQAAYFGSFIDTNETVTEYCDRMRHSGEWGGDIEIQAMCELYNRPVEVYAYGVTPMRVYNQNSNARPIRLSYHFQSHYNAIVDVSSSSSSSVEQKQELIPGEIEDNHLHRVSLSMANEANARNASERTSAKVARESDQIGTALALSRREFQTNSSDEFEQAVAASLQEFDSAEDSALAAAKTESLRAAQEAELIDAAKRESENLYLVEQMSQLSLTDTGCDGDMKRALELSQQSELDRALALSRAELKGADTILPAPVQSCLDLGFDEAAVLQAFSIFGTDPSVDETVTTQRMTEFLMNS